MTTMPLETLKQDLEGLLEQLHLGETVTLVDPLGAPVAVLVSLKPTPADTSPRASDWEAEWESLAQEVGRAWKSDQSAIETLAEMRR
jgi:antitoxin (DNA-binding transcriptional repressor) of toxin-antitoxin stability system